MALHHPVRALLVHSPGDPPGVADRVADADLGEIELTTAEGYGQGLQRLTAALFDIALVDEHLGERSGLDLLAEDAVRLSDTPVILLTAGGSRGEQRRAAAGGAVDALPRCGPDLATLERSLRHALRLGALKRERDELRTLIESSRELISVLEPDGTLRYVSPHLLEILGLRPAQMRGASALEEVHPDDRERVESVLGEILATPGCERQLRYRVAHRDGGWRMLDTIAHNRLDDPLVRGVMVYSWDVTELCDAEIRLQRSEAYFRTLAERAGVVLAVVDPDSTVRYASAEAAELLGGPPRQMVGRNGLDVVAERHRHCLRELLEIAAADPDTVHECRTSLVRMDGSERVVELTIRNLLDEPAVGGLVVTARDVTERLRREEHIRFQAALLERVGQPVLAVDDGGRVTYWNRAAEELMGWSWEEVRGQPILDRIMPQEARDTGLAARATVRAGGEWSGEIDLRTRSGEDVTVVAHASPVVDGAGEIVGRIAVGADVTEQRRAAEQLRFQAGLLDAVGQAVIATDLSRRVVYWNAAATRLYGWERDEVLGRDVVELNVPRKLATRASDIMERVEQGESWTDEYEVQRRDGTTLPALVTLSPFRDTRGEIGGVIGVSTDLRELKELEEKLRHSQRMEAVGRLAGGVAHDFNNLLTVIGGHSELLLESVSSGSPAYERVHQIRKQVQRASNLTMQLLAFVRRQVRDEEVVDLRAVLAEMEPVLGRLLPESLDLRFETDEPTEPVRADVGQLHQVILNLAVNASDAIDGPGRIVFRVDGYTLSQQQAEELPWRAEAGRYTRLTVDDTGHGMSDHVLDHIFEPFFTTKDAGEGSGLGLSMVYGIVKQGGGHILVDSEEGRGSRFQILLPAVDAVEERGEEPPEPLPRSRMETVLLVEDDPSVRDLVREMLESAGHRVVTADHGREALERVERGEVRPDVVLSDLVMPEMEGTELVERLREQRPDLPAVLISGYAHGTRTEVLDQADTAFLEKPFSSKRLIETIRRAMDG